MTEPDHEPNPVPDEHVQRMPWPGLWRQWVALLYDSLLLIALFFVSGFALIGLFGAASEIGQTTIPRTLYRLVMVCIVACFYTIFWLKSGQTLGMQAWRIRLVTHDGSPLGFGHVVKRLLAATVSWLPAGLGYWWALWDPEKRTWHDRLSGTRMIRVPKR